MQLIVYPCTTSDIKPSLQGCADRECVDGNYCAFRTCSALVFHWLVWNVTAPSTAAVRHQYVPLWCGLTALRPRRELCRGHVLQEASLPHPRHSLIHKCCAVVRPCVVIHPAWKEREGKGFLGRVE